MQPDGTSGVPEYDHGKYKVLSPKQSSNAPSPMFVTLFGTVSDASLEQPEKRLEPPENACSPMLLTPSGMRISTRYSQFPKAYPLIPTTGQSSIVAGMAIVAIVSGE